MGHLVVITASYMAGTLSGVLLSPGGLPVLQVGNSGALRASCPRSPESERLSQDLASNLSILAPPLSLRLAPSSSAIAQTHAQTPRRLGIAEDAKLLLYLPSSIRPRGAPLVGSWKPERARRISEPRRH